MARAHPEPTPGSAAAAQVAVGAPGSVVAVLDGDDLDAAAAGVAEIATGEPLTSRRRLRTGSVGKTYVAAITLLLVRDGTLGLDDRADAYVPELDPRITIRHLLSHRSGLFDHVLAARSPSGTSSATRTRPIPGSSSPWRCATRCASSPARGSRTRTPAFRSSGCSRSR